MLVAFCLALAGCDLEDGREAGADDGDVAGGKTDAPEGYGDFAFTAVSRQDWEAGNVTINGLPVREVESIDELFEDPAQDIPVAAGEGEGEDELEFRFAFAIPVVYVLAVGSFVILAAAAQHASQQTAVYLDSRDWRGLEANISFFAPQADEEIATPTKPNVALQTLLDELAQRGPGQGGEEPPNPAGGELWKQLLLPALAFGVATATALREDEDDPEGCDFHNPKLIPRSEGLRRWPYLQRVASTSATVMWTTTLGQSAPGVIRYRPRDSETWSVETARSEFFSTTHTGASKDYTQYRAELEWLRPGTAYCYEVWSGETLLAANLLLRTDIKHAPRPTRILVLGDSGTDTDDQYRLRDTLVEQDAEMLLHVGDLAYDPALEGKPATYHFLEKAFFKAYRQLFHRVPVYPTIGNHEESANQAEPYLRSFAFPTLCNTLPPGFDSPCKTAMERLPQLDRGRYYSFDHANMHFVSLDTNPELLDVSGRRQRMLDWLEYDLRHTSATWKIVFFHEPAYVSAKQEYDGSREVRQHIMPILEKHDVDIVFAGDTHLYERTARMTNGAPDPGGILHITSGAGGRKSKKEKTPAPFSEYIKATENSFVRFYALGCSGYGEAVGPGGQVFDTFHIDGCK